jgi:hypothetical protein
MAGFTRGVMAGFTRPTKSRGGVGRVPTRRQKAGQETEG